MSRLRAAAVLAVWLTAAAGARAGLYYSEERYAELPSQWRGFLLDQRTLRSVAAPPTAKGPANPARARYEDAAARLEKAARERKLTPDEWADLGAVHVRLGNAARAVEVLRAAQREHPFHFRIAANLGTAWQMQGDLGQAAAALREAVRLAPGKFLQAEEHHLKLVQQRQRQRAGDQELDDLFGVRFVGDKGEFEPGRIAADQLKRLPAGAAAVAQQLALWLPADSRLLWQLAELANAHGDVRTAAAIFDGCVTEFGLRSPELRRRRQLARAAADALADKTRDKEAHEGHAAAFQPRSKRPLLSAVDASPLPAVSAAGVNAVPWSVLAETTVGREFKPAFAKYLQELNGKQVTLTGYVQPLGEDLELSSFMLIEYPVGCWYCETPDVAGILFVELPADKTFEFHRNLVRVTGRLSLNATDPENFLYTIHDAKVAEAGEGK
jgi:tetratricopeptide (TPR) repeat protein